MYSQLSSNLSHLKAAGNSWAVARDLFTSGIKARGLNLYEVDPVGRILKYFSEASMDTTEKGLGNVTGTDSTVGESDKAASRAVVEAVAEFERPSVYAGSYSNEKQWFIITFLISPGPLNVLLSTESIQRQGTKACAGHCCSSIWVVCQHSFTRIQNQENVQALGVLQ